MNELDFTIELNAEGVGQEAEEALFMEADTRLRRLANGRNDMIGAAINVREAGQTEKTFLYEVTVVAYVRPQNIAATKKDANPAVALNEALNAVERQVRKKRERLGRKWEQPDGGRVVQEVSKVVAAEGDLNVEETL